MKERSGRVDSNVFELPIRVSHGEALRLVDMLGAQLIAPVDKVQSDCPVSIARRLLSMYRKKHQLLGDLTSDTSWMMLLDLYVSRYPARDICLTSVCLASLSPLTTAQRHLRILEQLGLVERKPAKHDARLVYVKLTDIGVKRIEELLAQFD